MAEINADAELTALRNACRILRDNADGGLGFDAEHTLTMEMVSHFEALDDHLSADGWLPHAWLDSEGWMYQEPLWDNPPQRREQTVVVKGELL